jgi:hypothetical protein
MISTVQDLSKGAFSERVDNLVAVCQVIMIDNKIIAPIIIVSVVISGVLNSSRLLLATSADTVNGSVVKDLFLLIAWEVLSLAAFEYGCYEVSVSLYNVGVIEETDLQETMAPQEATALEIGVIRRALLVLRRWPFSSSAVV